MAPAARASTFLRHYLVAVQFFTRLPVTGSLARWVGFSPEMLRASAAHFPGVGWLVGSAACAAFAIVSLVLPATGFTPLVAAVAATACTAWMTGAFHEDGLADLADGLGGSADRQRALEIMKDSRIGSFGAMALVLALLMKVGLLGVLAAASPTAAFAALLAAHVVSRFWPLLVIRTLAHIGDAAGSKSKPLADAISIGAVAIGATWCVVPLAVAVLAQGLAPIAAGVAGSALAFLWMHRLLSRRLQGFTGDGLGATQQVCELGFYFGVACALGAA
ncbi:adenosylcobinamide-GDP ribazoletransferase [Ramlibacter sp. Leaf400]|uniref:adenosylcobinamide-GDP ribazoletransferase n=1 Tax=Ramlibacter sp. Leaf400 TaxID=1736365 RepID=UPI0006F3561E|nr:adenosylcobinamide-GDP ribazoletransferase [Ramlibacter sp. Leaf400]KQT14052.1 cobalamin synthase [Ramlibacter sp. Leaf400]